VLNAETQVLTARQTMVDILTSQAVSRVTLLLAVGGSFDPRASGALADAPHVEPSSGILTRTNP
jgi:outer membrane protein TolC